MIARPPMTPPTMAPTGAGLKVEAAVAGEVDAAVEAAVDGDVIRVVLGDEVDVEVANVLVGVEDGAAVDDGGF
jgi:sulfate adenylyltransferase subunit 1 (EFTu-like GTPase family)